LGKAVTELVHGQAATAEATRASEILFGGGLEGVSESTFRDIVNEAPSKELRKEQLASPGLPMVEALVHSGLSTSKGQARKDIEGGGIYRNNVREESAQRTLTTQDLLFGRYLLLRKGKRNYVVLVVPE
jgi:tyrosyl-tRNA synthetase